MTEATDLTFAARRTSDMRLVAGVSTAHFVSHFYMLVLPPLFVFVKDDYGVSYTEVGLAITVFNLVSAVAQTPAGFLIDRINARFALIVGLLLGAAGFTVSDNGILAYRSGGMNERVMTWYDAAGKQLATVGMPSPYSSPAISPDSRRVAGFRQDGAAATSGSSI